MDVGSRFSLWYGKDEVKGMVNMMKNYRYRLRTPKNNEGYKYFMTLSGALIKFRQYAPHYDTTIQMKNYDGKWVDTEYTSIGFIPDSL